MSRSRWFHSIVASTLAIAAVVPATAAEDEKDEGDPYFSTLEWRNIGPSRGGRSVACAGVVGDRMTYYMGATGGGVWKTTDAGATWTNVSDEYFDTGSVGAVSVAQSDPNVVYVGMGETCVRGNLSHGDGVYKSVDAGKTWQRAGLENTRHIGDIEIHPKNADVAYVAALGHVFGPNEERGVYRTTDGGETWEKVLFVSDQCGAVEIAMDPSNPRVLYAGTWEVYRNPWELSSGGEGSGLYKSTDGGDTWEELTEGLPEGIKGKIGVTVSPVNPERVWAIVEADEGGVFRSDDAGETWKRINKNRALRQRAWYYSHIYADPQEENTVYVLNVRFHKSTDGGRTFTETIRVPHGDNHDLWIDPHDNQRMVNANDGGANVSFDGGESWSRQDNQPTAQFYHVTTDTQFPYRVYGAQQDNSTMSLSSENRLGRWRNDWYSVGGGESGYIAVRPDDPDIVYAGSYGGYLTRYNHETEKTRNVMVWPENPMGWGAKDLDYRFQWTFPIVISPHDPDTVYVGGNVLFRSRNGGHSWEPISPDLTTDDESKQGPSGGPITHDNTGVEYYCTIFSVAESPLREGLIWAGSDDGLVHVTSDGGDSWREVTPATMGDWPLINLIEASPHDPDKAYLAVTRYKLDDYTPYIYRTTDRGRTWELITEGIPEGAFVRAVREDPVREGLLFAGTETGVYVSFDDGEHWKPIQRNLPSVPITDLVIHENDVVLATQGRSFWIMDDIAPLRQLTDDLEDEDVHLFEPAVAHRLRGRRVRVHYWLGEEPEEPITIEFRDAGGEVIKSFSSKKDDADGEEEEGGFFSLGGGSEVASAEQGMNLFEWDMRYPDATETPGAVMWAGTTTGPMAAPGEYEAALIAGGETLTAPVRIKADPRIDTTQRQYEEQFDLLISVRDALSETHEAVNTIRDVREQIDTMVERSADLPGGESIASTAEDLKGKLAAVEEELIQVKSEAPQDPLNYPIKLNNKIAALTFTVESDFEPTEQMHAVFEQLSGELETHLATLERILQQDVPAFNRLVREHEVPAVVVGGGDEQE